jgi:hypothetical protein
VKTVAQIKKEREELKRKKIAANTTNIVVYNEEPPLKVPRPDLKLASELKDPATKDEKLCWAEEGLLPKEIEAKDLEDPEGLHSILGCSKLSSDADEGIQTASV